MKSSLKGQFGYAIRSSLCLVAIVIFTACIIEPQESRTEELVFHSGAFNIVGDLKLPGGRSPFPVVLFVHGDGPNDRTGEFTYPPIMERMKRAGYATFAWDKPGSGESTGQIDRSRLIEQRSQIVQDAINMLKERSDIDPHQIGIWGISQAGYVIPHLLRSSEDIAFIIAVSFPGEPGYKQGAYLVTAQAVCAGLDEADAERVKYLISAVETAQYYEDYVYFKNAQAEFPALKEIVELGFNMDVMAEADWHIPDLDGDYFIDPMLTIEKSTVPVLAFFGEKDTNIDPIQGFEAYQAALSRAGNPNSRVYLIPDTDHNLILSETGCLEERYNRPLWEWTNYAPGYLDTLEVWLRELQE